MFCSTSWALQVLLIGPVSTMVGKLGWPTDTLFQGGPKRKKKQCSGTSFPQKARGHSMCSTMVGGGWRLAVGNWRLVAVGGGWRRLVVGDW